MPWIPNKVLEATLKFNDPYDLNLFGPVIEKGDNADAIVKEDPLEMMNRSSVARWQNLIPSFPWIAPGWRLGGGGQSKERKESIFAA